MIGSALTIALVLASAPPPEDPVASPSEQVERRVALEIDHSGLLDHPDAATAEQTSERLREGMSDALRQLPGLDVVEDPDAPTIVVELGWADDEQSIHRITMKTRQPGHDARMLESFMCACIDSGVVRSVGERLPAALEQLAEPPPEPVESSPSEPVEPVEPPPIEPTEPTEATPVEPTDEMPKDDPRPGISIGAAGIASVAVMIVGAGTVGFGASALAKGTERIFDSQDEERTLSRDFRPMGRAWLGIGLSAVVVGTALFVIDLTVLHRRRAAAISLGPVLGPSTTGLRLHGRF